MITTPKGARSVIRPTAYDFEWEERCVLHGGRKPRKKDIGDECFICTNFTFRVTLCGAYDERGYRGYPTVKAFLRGELTRANQGRFYYAHFGGASDMVFMLRELVDDERYAIKGVFS